MSRITDVVKQDTPRLIVEFQRDESGREKFGWGVVGQLPVITLVGYIVRIQAELAFRNPEECEAMALIIAYNTENNKFDYFVNPNIPVDSLVGMLEAIKMTLVESQMQSRSQVGIFGADGRPLHNRR